MSKIYIILSLLLFFISCEARQIEGKIDSLALLSREKADRVLNQFDSLGGAKILYSLKDENYVILQKENKYHEYYVSLDSSGRIGGIHILKSKRENRKMFSKAFLSDNYHSGFKTNMPKATYVRGVPSYFVMKGEDGKRHGEYSLSSLTLPTPIEGDMYAYVTKRLSEEMSLKNK